MSKKEKEADWVTIIIPGRTTGYQLIVNLSLKEDVDYFEAVEQPRIKSIQWAQYRYIKASGVERVSDKIGLFYSWQPLHTSVIFLMTIKERT